MIIVMKQSATVEQINAVEEYLTDIGLKTHPIYGEEHTVIGAVGDSRSRSPETILLMPGVEKIVPILKPYKLVSKELYSQPSSFKIGNVPMGGPGVFIIAGPCAVESEEQVMKAGKSVKELGCHALRGGAFKPRTSPYDFMGLGQEGLEILSRARKEYGLPIVSELMDPRDIDKVCEHVDVLQIGARNMQNFPLLKEVGQSDRPVLLKRGLAATVDEWLMAAEYIMNQGNQRIVLCERGIRTYENGTRNTLDISAVLQVKEKSHLPVVVDPSHGTGVANMVCPMALAAIAAGADGVMVEVHPEPSKALCDGRQSLDHQQLSHLVNGISKVSVAIGRHLAQCPPVLEPEQNNPAKKEV